MFPDYELGLGVFWEKEQQKEGPPTTGQKKPAIEVEPDWEVVGVVCCKTEIQDSDLCELLAGARKVISGGKISREREISGAESLSC